MFSSLVYTQSPRAVFTFQNNLGMRSEPLVLAGHSGERMQARPGSKTVRCRSIELVGASGGNCRGAAHCAAPIRCPGYAHKNEHALLINSIVYWKTLLYAGNCVPD